MTDNPFNTKPTKDLVQAVPDRRPTHGDTRVLARLSDGTIVSAESIDAIEAFARAMKGTE